MNITVQVDFHAIVQQIFGEKSLRVALGSPLTVQNLLQLVCTSPARRQAIFSDGGDLRNDVKILKNGRSIVFLKGLDTELNNGDVIAIFPPVVGG